MTFADLNISDGIVSALNEINILEPSEIQEKVIPQVLSGNDVYVKSHYGNGKTASFLLPILEKLEGHVSGSLRCLIIVPSSNYAHKIKLNLSLYAKNTDLIYVNLNDRKHYDENMEYISTGIDILISTPDLLNDHILDNIIDVSSTEFMVLDETDLMVELNHFDDLYNIIDSINNLSQSVIFTTQSYGYIEEIKNKIQKNVCEFDFLEDTKDTQLLKENTYITSGFRSKLNYLISHLGQEDYRNLVVYIQSYKNADEVFNRLKRIYQYKVAFLNRRKMPQKHKLFRLLLDGKVRILIVCVDDLEDDIKLHGVHQIINFDFYLSIEEYEERKKLLSGFNKQVTVTTFVNEVELEKLNDFESQLNKNFDKLGLDDTGHFIPYREDMSIGYNEISQPEFGRKSRDRKRRF